MANPINFVPLTTPMFDGDMKALGNLNRLWAQFFGSESGWISQGTHAARLLVNPGGVPDGALYVETDRRAIYESRFVGSAQAWVYVVGLMRDTLANRPVDVGPNDAGFIYNSTDALDYRWSGTAWATLGTVRGGANLTDVNRVTKVTAAGVIGEAAFADSNVVLGAPSLVDVGAVPKVDSAGTLTESAAKDDGTVLSVLARILSIGRAAPWGSAIAECHAGTDENFGVSAPVTLADGIAIHSYNDAVNANKGMELRASTLLLSMTALGFFGATAAAKQTLNAYTTNDRSAAFTSTPVTVATAATLVDLNTLRVAYENLRASYDDLRTKLKTTTLVG